MGERVGMILSVVVLGCGGGSSNTKPANTAGPEVGQTAAASTITCDVSYLDPNDMSCDAKNARCNAGCYINLDGQCEPKGGFQEVRICQSNCGMEYKLCNKTGTTNVVHNATIQPPYILLTLVYTPPGIGSKVVYADGSSTGTTNSVSHAFKAGLVVKVSTNVVDVSSSVVSGVKDTQTFTATRAQGAQYGATSTANDIDHSQDLFTVWMNPKIAMSGTDAAVELTMGTAGPAGTEPQVFTYTASEINDPSQLKVDPNATGSDLVDQPRRKALHALKDADRIQLLGLDPFFANPTLMPPEPRFQRRPGYELLGPSPKPGTNDCTGATIPMTGPTLNTAQSTGGTHTTLAQISFSVLVGGEVDFFVKASAKAGFSMEWDFENSQSTTVGQTQSASSLLSSTTCGYARNVDIYEDTMLETFAFVVEDPGSTSERIIGTLRDGRKKPLPNKEVLVEGPGWSRTLFTDAYGNYRVLAPKDATGITVTAFGEKKTPRLGKGPVRQDFVESLGKVIQGVHPITPK